ncbi:MAG: zinc-binding alcohol dehydrogenase [Rhodobacteraceae bacterium]|jgi:threonine dehydrogenase-like Zn-dependent dehydrogenase|nr:zinc-binding alcohol dehydrogenase [Paracoccaceae bacterium]
MTQEQPATALWLTGPDEAGHRPFEVRPAPGEVTVDTLFTGISRGTERLVADGRVPPDEADRMRAPLMQGTFPFPVAYGYCAVGRIAGGARHGQTVFALAPHATRFACPDAMAVPVPQDLPPGRAILAANMETALTVLWDSGAGPGDRVTVVGAGVVGALSGYLAARLPGAEVTLVDVEPARADLAARLGCRFARPDDAAGGQDVVIHTSARAAGLARALDLCGPEATVVEASWYGSGTVPVPLGAAFHSQRLRIVGSQVGRVPPARAPRWTYRRRIETALRLLADPALDALISGETAFSDLPGAYRGILRDPATLMHRVRY